MNVKNIKSENTVLNKQRIIKELRIVKKGQKRPDGIFGSFMT